MRRRNIKGTPFVPDNAIVLYKTSAYGPNPNPAVMQVLQDKGITTKDYLTKKDCEQITEDLFYQGVSYKYERHLGIFKNNTEIQDLSFLKYCTSITHYYYQNTFGTMPNLKVIAFPDNTEGIVYPFTSVPSLECDVVIPKSCTVVAKMFAGATKVNVIFENYHTATTPPLFYGNNPELIDPENKVIQSPLYYKDTLIFYPRGRQNAVIDDSPFNTSECYIASAFKNNTDILYIEINGNITKLGGLSFYGATNLKLLTINANLSEIGANCFYNCNSLKVLDLSNTKVTSLTNLGANSGIQTVILPTTCTTIGQNAFNMFSALKYIDVSNVTNLQYSAFQSSGISEITLNDAITNIPNACFRYANMYSFTFPDKCVRTETMAFDSCTKLQYVNLKNCEVLEVGTFDHCYNLHTFYGLENVKYPMGIAGGNKFDYRSNAQTAYQKNTVLDESNYIDNICYANKYAVLSADFLNLPEDEPVKFREGTVCICDYAFCNDVETSTNYKNSKLFTIDLDGILYIGSNAFRLSRLTNVIIPKSVIRCSNNAFNLCRDLLYAEINCDYIRIPFSGCTSLKKLVIHGKNVGNGVDGSGNEQLSGCTELETLETDYALYGNYAVFKNCTKLTNIIAHCTKAEWEANLSSAKFGKRSGSGGGWGTYSSIKTVTCSDGVIDYSGPQYD